MIIPVYYRIFYNPIHILMVTIFLLAILLGLKSKIILKRNDIKAFNFVLKLKIAISSFLLICMIYNIYFILCYRIFNLTNFLDLNNMGIVLIYVGEDKLSIVFFSSLIVLSLNMCVPILYFIHCLRLRKYLKGIMSITNFMLWINSIFIKLYIYNIKKKLLGKKRKRISESLLVYGIREEKEFIYYSKIVELPLKTMKKYEIKEYDYVIIKYDNRKIIAMVLEDFSDEHDEDYIRLNSIMRKNLLVDIGYKIRLKKCSKIDEIDEIVLKPLRNKKRTYKYYVINY